MNVKTWTCQHVTRCADTACSYNPAMQLWVGADGECRACGGAGCVRCYARHLPTRPAHRTNPAEEAS